jgi:6-pyruvoyltetrahydropterin/6-carboxytetrahydropterin synthase
MPFDIVVTREFSAAHALRLPNDAIEPVHGHNWRVAITVSAATLDEIGVVMDFHELERMVDAIIASLHNRHLNDVPPFDSELNPTAENVALHFGRALHLPHTVRLAKVEVWETNNCCAVYRPI